MRFIEPVAVVDVLVTGVAAVEIIRGGLIRFIHYVEQRDETGEMVGVINSRIVMSLDLVSEARGQSDSAIAAHQRDRREKAIAHAH